MGNSKSTPRFGKLLRQSRVINFLLNRSSKKMETDYLMLSRQYASFLIAVGGVSITVLALVLSLLSTSPLPLPRNSPQPFLIAGLMVATVSCFTGAHMMAETAGFITHAKGLPSGQRLFLLASTNVYIATLLLIFALTLLPEQSGKVDLAQIKWIPVAVMLFIIIGALCWMYRSVVSRMPSDHGRMPAVVTLIAGGIGFGVLLCLTLRHCISPTRLLHLSFLPILIFTLSSLLIFAGTFHDGDKVRKLDVWLFCSSVTYTCASLAVIAVKQEMGGW